MTHREFSDQFDVLYNNITSNQAPGLNEFEKSVFLSKAQNELIKNYFNPKANPKGDGFDDSPKRQADFNTIIRVGNMTETTSQKFDRRSSVKTFTYPDPDMLLVLNEQVRDSMYDYVVVPISYQEYDRLMAKPYKYPPKYQAWRLITNAISSTGTVSRITAATKTFQFDVPADPGQGSDVEETDYTISFTTVYDTTSSTTVEIDFAYSRSTKYASSITGETNKTITLTLGDVITLEELVSYLHNDSTIRGYVSVVGTGTDGDKSFYDLFGTTYEDSITLTPTSEQVAVTRGTPTVELIGRFNSGLTYTVRYVKKPYPIILADFTDSGLSIDDYYSPRTPVCELPSQLHEEILQRAVELAKVAWTSNGQENVQLVMQAGQRSE